MYTISKMFAFSASHQLHGLPLEHPCSRLHGHNYEIIVELRADTLNNVGFVKDYRELDGLKIYIDDVLDHRDLNNVLHFNPTAENIARHLFEEFKITNAGQYFPAFV